ncbi:hypothetical protein MRS44_006417 [Fusarium solani]|uniref:Uncharacterized protein n=1 Tax=Fusarium solani TaxID=169388 RepID=A0A9P9L709_FUSSL|nr:uncharacterized protein B0J15DRAFT_457547 [Fusarium solani]KAH7275372.1 hypothetical protein B0J15DRAFT_457547 [Fusarium solani]KAJ3465759.1 hypothetical protein MRS44_006417 [Fusarium solani]
MPRNQALRSKWLAAVPPPPHTWSGLLCPVSGVFLSSKPDLSQSKPVFVAYRRSLDGRVLAYSCTRAGARNGWLRFSGSGQRPWFSPRLYHIRSTATASAALLGPEAGLCVHLPKHNCPIAMSTMGRLLIETSSSRRISSRAAMVRRVSAARDLIPECIKEGLARPLCGLDGESRGDLQHGPALGHGFLPLIVTVNSVNIAGTLGGSPLLPVIDGG